jgi:hypothetical protein
VPQLVIETTSRKTKKKDTVDKPQLYAQLGIHEYFLFDPTSDYLDPPLQGYRLQDNQYQRIASEPSGGLISQELDLELQINESQLNFFRRDTGERLLTNFEKAELEAAARQREFEARQREVEARQRESEERQREVEARLRAEAEVERLRAELAKHLQAAAKSERKPN